MGGLVPIPVMRTNALAAVALFAVTGCLSSCRGQHPQPQDAFMLLTRLEKMRAAEVVAMKNSDAKGDASNQVLLGFAYQNGFAGLPKDLAAARGWYQSAATQGYSDASTWLVILDDVEGRDPKGVRERLMALAETGNVLAMNNYAFACSEGKGGARDPISAVVWWRKAANAGSAEGAYNVGVSYAQGEGVQKDQEEAVRWYRQAASRGMALAAARLGPMAMLKQAGLQPDAEAVGWLKQAANEGDPVCMLDLGMALAHGLGTAVDYPEAYFWFILAAERGQIDGREGIKAKLTERQISDAVERARKWDMDNQ